MENKKNFYIDGKWVAPKSKKEIKVINPATEENCAVISLGNKEDVDMAVTSAKKAYNDWAFSTKERRIQLLEKLYENYKKRWADIADAITTEMGAPKDFATKLQAGTGAAHLKSFIRYLKNFEFEKPLGKHAPNQRLIYEPKGVCALITPWNWPMNQVCLKVMPALASGCTMILKPSELAPLSSMILAELIDETKFPPGVFNLVNGDGATTGDALTSHPDVNMISFTGSTRAGALISQNAAKDFKRVSLELGGKGANIIFKDADPEAIERGALRCFRNSGQSCNAPTRMLVEKSMYEEAIDRLKKYTENFEVGDPKKEGEHIGPVISETQYNKIQTLIKKGIDEGAKLVAGGPGKPEGLDKGYFVKPTVFADVNNNMEVARTEIFGPVLSVMPFETEEEAIEIANDTPYGLTNYIQTQDPEKVKRVARKLRSGMVDVNGAGIAVDAPFGGFKHSGIGREAGEHGLEEFLEVKSVGGWS
ncbi:MAG: aldehyde dehydrogenase family protein [Pelagibacteraceae bacterium TMED201]|nr:MAG: aldehyde dehydrogenase family protein [Pelagibacteraceae bacterium TMED201]|tara:strand:- start:2833 stop:4266 length:1434 start_codon:yes stop_codon:yes gene_type:complete